MLCFREATPGSLRLAAPPACEGRWRLPEVATFARCPYKHLLHEADHDVGDLAIVMDNRCVNRIVTGVAVGGALGGSVGAMWGTYEAFALKVPGIYKIRYIGQTTLTSAAVFGLFLGAGSLLHCGRSQGY